MKVVLIGYGYWGKIIEKYIKKDGNFELVGLCSPDLENSIVKEDIVKDDSIEGVFICTPISTHYSLVKEMLEAGKHVFCEKPLCKEIEQTMELINIAKERKLCLFTDYIYTCSPSINYIKDNISSYNLGKLVYCECNIKQFGKFYPSDDVFSVLSVHFLASISYIFEADFANIKKNNNFRGLNHLTYDGTLELDINNSDNSLDRSARCTVRASLLHHKKERNMILHFEHGSVYFDMLDETHTVSVYRHTYETEPVFIDQKKFDEFNNLSLAVKSFYDHTQNHTSNFENTISVSRALDIIYNGKE